jgi:pimeloyl-ACP methyl ester carboxylesterase
MIRARRQLFRFAFCCLMILLSACATPTVRPNSPNAIIIVPGLGGDGGVYTRLAQTLATAEPDDCISVSDWGSSWPVFLISISSTSWHKNAEQHLADCIIQWRTQRPHSQIVLIAHSAGAGVVAGALARLPTGVGVGPVIFLAPDLSPNFDLRPALAHATVLHVFYSHHDNFFQGIGPEIVGTYDRIHSDGAGRDGFDVAQFTSNTKSKIIEHVYQANWKALANNGGHYDWMAPQFVEQILEPLLNASNVQTAGLSPAKTAEAKRF